MAGKTAQITVRVEDALAKQLSAAALAEERPFAQFCRLCLVAGFNGRTAQRQAEQR